mmetsp:Transcript_3734/g.5519  ORF Transcript_3734/g.5519 Transcript_3734/m.5519 type:complete len:513 (+) Transcript_3734:23-1561(+)
MNRLRATVRNKYKITGGVTWKKHKQIDGIKSNHGRTRLYRCTPQYKLHYDNNEDREEYENEGEQVQREVKNISMKNAEVEINEVVKPRKRSLDQFSMPKVEKPDFGLTLKDIMNARTLTLPLLKNTPLINSPLVSELVPGGNRVHLKYELRHLTGSFKERGAVNRLAQLTPEEKERGVVAASAGNHAQAVSYHASRLGISSKIVMPEQTPLAKVQGTAKWGGQVVLKGTSLYQCLQHANEIVEEENRVLIHPYNDEGIIAGQGTMGIELIEQNPLLDAVIIPIGGGGLISGTAMAMKEINPRIKIYGVEAANMPAMKKSMEAGHVVDVPFVKTLADGIAIKGVGEKTFPIVDYYVDEVVSVTENEIAAAVMLLLEKERTMVEGAGATALAALMFNKLDLKNKDVCCVLTGGNIDLTVLREIIDRGLVNTGRLAKLRFTINDSPGNLVSILTVLAELGCNVSEVEHERAFLNIVGSVSVVVTAQTKGIEHLSQIKESLRSGGFNFRVIKQFED